ncbi:MAG: NTP transferase domain-containing protein [Opitutaceae bacterium]|nr:NTP transferase domain-containing protein [Opitutaceae bacterium]
MTLSAAIIAGGFSRRMGRDKALLPDAAHGTLLQRQVALVAALAPGEVLLSCRPDQDLRAPPHVRRIHDPGTHGPLGGLAALLAAMHGDLLLVLAVDLGRMTPAMLQRLAAASAPGCGVVPRTARGIEPLAAVYPATLAREARARVAAGRDLALHAWSDAGVAAGALRWMDIAAADEAAFTNWNTPDDLHS